MSQDNTSSQQPVTQQADSFSWKNPNVQNTLIGAGIGAGAGLLFSSSDNDDEYEIDEKGNKQKKKKRSSIGNALLGATIGGAAGYFGGNYVRGLFDKPEEATEDDLEDNTPESYSGIRKEDTELFEKQQGDMLENDALTPLHYVSDSELEFEKQQKKEYEIARRKIPTWQDHLETGWNFSKEMFPYFALDTPCWPLADRRNWDLGRLAQGKYGMDATTDAYKTKMHVKTMRDVVRSDVYKQAPLEVKQKMLQEAGARAKLYDPRTNNWLVRTPSTNVPITFAEMRKVIQDLHADAKYMNATSAEQKVMRTQARNNLSKAKGATNPNSIFYSQDPNKPVVQSLDDIHKNDTRFSTRHGNNPIVKAYTSPGWKGSLLRIPASIAKFLLYAGITLPPWIAIEGDYLNQSGIITDADRQKAIDDQNRIVHVGMGLGLADWGLTGGAKAFNWLTKNPVGSKVAPWLFRASALSRAGSNIALAYALGRTIGTHAQDPRLGDMAAQWEISKARLEENEYTQRDAKTYARIAAKYPEVKREDFPDTPAGESSYNTALIQRITAINQDPEILELKAIQDSRLNARSPKSIGSYLLDNIGYNQGGSLYICNEAGIPYIPGEHPRDTYARAMIRQPGETEEAFNHRTSFLRTGAWFTGTGNAAATMGGGLGRGARKFGRGFSNFYSGAAGYMGGDSDIIKVDVPAVPDLDLQPPVLNQGEYVTLTDEGQPIFSEDGQQVQTNKRWVSASALQALPQYLSYLEPQRHPDGTQVFMDSYNRPTSTKTSVDENGHTTSLPTVPYKEGDKGPDGRPVRPVWLQTYAFKPQPDMPQFPIEKPGERGRQEINQIKDYIANAFESRGIQAPEITDEMAFSCRSRLNSAYPNQPIEEVLSYRNAKDTGVMGVIFSDSLLTLGGHTPIGQGTLATMQLPAPYIAASNNSSVAYTAQKLEIDPEGVDPYLIMFRRMDPEQQNAWLEGNRILDTATSLQLSEEDEKGIDDMLSAINDKYATKLDETTQQAQAAAGRRDIAGYQKAAQQYETLYNQYQTELSTAMVSQYQVLQLQHMSSTVKSIMINAPFISDNKTNTTVKQLDREIKDFLSLLSTPTSTDGSTLTPKELNTQLDKQYNAVISTYQTLLQNGPQESELKPIESTTLLPSAPTIGNAFDYVRDKHIVASADTHVLASQVTPELAKNLAYSLEKYLDRKGDPGTLKIDAGCIRAALQDPVLCNELLKTPWPRNKDQAQILGDKLRQWYPNIFIYRSNTTSTTPQSDTSTLIPIRNQSQTSVNYSTGGQAPTNSQSDIFLNYDSTSDTNVGWLSSDASINNELALYQSIGADPVTGISQVFANQFNINIDPTLLQEYIQLASTYNGYLPSLPSNSYEAYAFVQSLPDRIARMKETTSTTNENQSQWQLPEYRYTGPVSMPTLIPPLTP